jgi:hypothetical protein
MATRADWAPDELPTEGKMSLIQGGMKLRMRKVR